MKSVAMVLVTLSAGFVFWACKVRVGEQSSLAASEANLATMDGVNCQASPTSYPKFTDVTLDPDHAALRFTLEDQGNNGAAFTLRYFTHATKYYDPQKDVRFYALRLGDNLVDFEATEGKVQKIYYKPAGSALVLTCK